MANPVHEKLLREGVEEWNAWRARNAGVTPDLSFIRMTGAKLDGCELRHARLEGSTLIRAHLPGADLRHADLRGASLHEVDLSDADLYRAKLDGAILAGAKLRRARLQSASLRCAQITVADLRRADFREARLDGADLRESLALGASFERACLRGAELALCQLGGANLLSTSDLVPHQLEAALLDASTLVAPGLCTSPPRDGGGTLSDLVESLLSLRSRASGPSVPEPHVRSFHAVLHRIEEHGFDTREARVQDRELVRSVAFDARAPGGEAFEVAPAASVDGAVFRRKLDGLLDRLRLELLRTHSG